MTSSAPPSAAEPSSRRWKAAATALWGAVLPWLRLERRSRRHPAVLVIGLCAILGWQIIGLRPHRQHDAPYHQTASAGLHFEKDFTYFLYYLGLFPLAPVDSSKLEYSKEGAKRLLDEQPRTLLMDRYWTWAEGDRGKMWPFLYDAYVKGKPAGLSVVPFNSLVWRLSLCALFASFWWVGLPLLGGITVLLLGSNPFQITSVYTLANVHGWVITTAVLMVAVHLPLMAAREQPRRWLLIATPILAGLMLATIRCIRSEPAPIAAAAAFCYLTVARTPWRWRAGALAIFVAVFTLTNVGWNRWFDAKEREVARLLTERDGYPLSADRPRHHNVWHPIYCGLGDLDTKYGYQWLDEAPLDYATPIIQKRWGIYVPPTVDGNNGRKVGGNLPRAAYWDDNKMYRRLPYGLPEYVQVIREKILGDISKDPLWYLGILAKRTQRLAEIIPPVRVAVTKYRFDLPVLGVMIVPVLGLLLAARAFTLAKLVVFTLPTCATALLIFSDRGTTYYAVYHYFVAAVLIWTALALLDALSARFTRHLARAPEPS